MKDERTFLSKIPDKVKINVCRWWFFGALFFLIAWGTNISSNKLDLIFFMGVGIGIGNIFIFNPLMYSIFDVERNGKLINKKYYERKVLEGVFVKLAEIFKCLLCSFLVWAIYQGINISFINILNLDENKIPFPAEPICYGIFFLLMYLGISAIVDLIIRIKDKVKDKKQNKIVEESSEN